MGAETYCRTPAQHASPRGHLIGRGPGRRGDTVTGAPIRFPSGGLPTGGWTSNRAVDVPPSGVPVPPPFGGKSTPGHSSLWRSVARLQAPLSSSAPRARAPSGSDRLGFGTVVFPGGGVGAAVLGNATSGALPNGFSGPRVPHADQGPDMWRRTQLMRGPARVVTAPPRHRVWSSPAPPRSSAPPFLPPTVNLWALMVPLTFSSVLSSLHGARDASEERTDIETLDDGSTPRRTGPHESGATPPSSALLPRCPLGLGAQVFQPGTPTPPV